MLRINTISQNLGAVDSNERIIKYFIEGVDSEGSLTSQSEILDVRITKSSFGREGYTVSISAWSASPKTIEEVQLLASIWQRAELEARLAIATLELAGHKATFAK